MSDVNKLLGMGKNKPYVQRGLKFFRETITVKEYLLLYNIIDTQPVGQRLDVAPKLEGTEKTPSKAQGIISTMMKGYDIGQITIHKIPKKSALKPYQFDGKRISQKGTGLVPADSYTFASIDGGNRKRYIYAFVNNQFRVDGKLWVDYSQEERDDFLNYPLLFAVYVNLTPSEIGDIFRTLNKTTPVNRQETLNSYGDIAIANAVRETARLVAGINSTCHPLFDYSVKNLAWLTFDPSRLKLDEIVARIYYRYHSEDKGGIGLSAEKQLLEMYSDEDLDFKKVDNLKKKVFKTLDHVKRMAEVKKMKLNSGLGKREFELFKRVWMYMEKEFGSFKIIDDAAYFDTLKKVMDEKFFKPVADMKEPENHVSPYNQNKTIGLQFKDTLGEYDDAERMKTCLGWFTQYLDFTQLITIKDTRRFFSKTMRESKLAEQGYKCAVDGKPLKMENAHGGHLVAHSRGGKTEFSNLVMISAKHNLDMGSMSFVLYKELNGY